MVYFIGREHQICTLMNTKLPDGQTTVKHIKIAHQTIASHNIVGQYIAGQFDMSSDIKKLLCDILSNQQHYMHSGQTLGSCVWLCCNAVVLLALYYNTMYLTGKPTLWIKYVSAWYESSIGENWCRCMAMLLCNPASYLYRQFSFIEEVLFTIRPKSGIEWEGIL